MPDDQVEKCKCCGQVIPRMQPNGRLSSPIFEPIDMKIRQLLKEQQELEKKPAGISFFGIRITSSV